MAKYKAGQTTIYIDKDIRADLERLMAIRKLEKLDDENYDLPVSINAIVNESLKDYITKHGGKKKK